MLAYNSSTHDTTSVTPFYANKGFEAETDLESRLCKELVHNAKLEVDEIRTMQSELVLDLQFFRERMKRFANTKRVRGPTLKEGDKVYLLRRTPNTKQTIIRTTRPSDKLDFAKLGPFKIAKVLGPVTYELKLPDKMRLT